jgi:hypothetical protein
LNRWQARMPSYLFWHGLGVLVLPIGLIVHHVGALVHV